MSRRTGLLAVVALLLAGTLAVTWHRVEGRQCGADVHAVADPRSPLLSAATMAQRPQQRRDRLVRALDRMSAPFGKVLAGADYYYEQWLHLYGVTGGVLAWTKRNAPVTYLDGSSLQPVWGLRPESNRVAWDASADSFLLLSLSAKQDTEVASYDLANGSRRWCVTLSTTSPDGAPLTTGMLPDGSVVVASARSAVGGATEVVGLSKDGHQAWRVTSRDVDRADFVGTLGDLVVVGGREDYRLAEPPPSGASLSAFRAGKVAWRYRPPSGSTVHVLGPSGGGLLVLERAASGTVRLLALDGNGRPGWDHPVPRSALQSTMRGDVVLLKSDRALLAYSARDGRRLWRQPIPHTFNPYGFTLAMMPSLDADHLLVPTTTDLRIVDLQSGRQRSFRLPVDGINTTYWPYQLLATDRLLGVLTNTGAVVVRRTADGSPLSRPPL